MLDVEEFEESFGMPVWDMFKIKKRDYLAGLKGKKPMDLGTVAKAVKGGV